MGTLMNEAYDYDETKNRARRCGDRRITPRGLCIRDAQQQNRKMQGMTQDSMALLVHDFNAT